MEIFPVYTRCRRVTSRSILSSVHTITHLESQEYVNFLDPIFVTLHRALGNTCWLTLTTGYSICLPRFPRRFKIICLLQTISVLFCLIAVYNSIIFLQEQRHVVIFYLFTICWIYPFTFNNQLCGIFTYCIKKCFCIHLCVPSMFLIILFYYSISILKKKSF